MIIVRQLVRSCFAVLSLLVFLPLFSFSSQEGGILLVGEQDVPLTASEEVMSHLTSRVEPVYPPLAKMTRIRGSVLVRLIIGTDGKVRGARALSGHPLLVQAALDAVRQWSFTPFVKNGLAVEVMTDVSVELPVTTKHRAMSFPEVHDLGAVTITLSRGSYGLKISGDGTVEYDGSGAVCVEGKHRGRISEADFRTLLDDFRGAGYFSLEDEYGGVATDSYTTTSSIAIGYQKKQVQYMVDAPDELTKLEDAIDHLSHSQKWVNCDAETVPALLAEGINLHSPDSRARSLLFGSVSYGGVEAVRDLVRAGAEVRVTDDNGQTPLMIAAKRGLPEMVKALLAAGDNPNAADKYGVTVLIHGASSGNAEVLRALLEVGAQSNERSKSGNTALMAAAAAGNPILVEQLLRAGANIKAKGWKNTTALLAGSMGEIEFEYLNVGESHAEIPGEVIDRAKVVRLLIDAGANVNDVNEEGENALFTIYEEAVRELVKTRIDINARNNDGETPLIATVAPEVAEVLVRAGVKLDLTDTNGQTALMHGAKNNYVENLKVLVRAGANLDLQDSEGSTALMLCAEKGLEDSAKVLANAHANVNLRDHQGLTALGRLYKSGGGNGRAATERLLLAAGGTE